MRASAIITGVLVGALSACASGPTPPPGARGEAPRARTAAREARPPRFEARADANVIPREVLFGEPHRKSVQVSPDGKRLGFIADAGEKRMGLFVAPIDRPEEKVPVRVEKGELERWTFAGAPDWLLYVHDPGGKELQHVRSIDVAHGERSIDLTPPQRIARIARTSLKRPYEVALFVRSATAEVDDVFVADIRTGASKMVFENKDRSVLVGLDDDYVPRIGGRPRADGDYEVLRLLPDGTSKDLFRIEGNDDLTTSLIGLDSAGTTLFLRDSRGRATSALAAIDLATGAETILAEDPKADAVEVLREAGTARPEAVLFDSGKRRWRALSDRMRADLAALETDGMTLDVIERSGDRSKWIVAEHAPDRPTTFFVYDRATRTKRALFSDRPELEKHQLRPMDVVDVRTRDGLDLVGYLTLPKGPHPVPAAPVPLVLLVHGGPWSRAEWVLDPLHQLFASRGYGTLSVNFRGSTGFGKALANAGDREWGAKMQDDLVDAVAWAVKSGIADPKRVAIFGGSWGGYAALIGAHRDRETFACAVDIAGPADLVSLMERLPPKHAPMVKRFRLRVGDPTTDAGRRELVARSPVSHASEIEMPLLMIHGANDPRVSLRDGERVAEFASANGARVTLLVYDDEGHGFSDPRNWVSLSAIAEVFLSQCLGGVHEPFGDALGGSSVRELRGGRFIPGLSRAALVP